ncbi:MAG: deoxyuridine 5'-triphosphate nucleotidohydrolase [Lachnospiraceae bacterium]|jgi:dUTP pyrophosphatase|nr:deoxyuridine 5'-triphosphate nucleotidohydrolase [Lachnospiraceae bacterium]
MPNRRIAKFEKVSYVQFKSDFIDCFPKYRETNDAAIKAIYDAIKLPRRATKGSAGYDFFTPIVFKLEPGQTIKIPTGIRAWMEEEWVLQFFPRSGLGFKYRLQLNNTVGIIDSDYYGSDNEGHIFVKLTNDSNEGKVLSLSVGDGFMQGIFFSYGLTIDDDSTKERNGGFGSTNI